MMQKLPLNSFPRTEVWILCFVYFVCLLPIYTWQYYAPDFFLYHAFGRIGFATRDGFSTLFLNIAALPLRLAGALHVFCLLLMSFSLGVFTYFAQSMVRQRGHQWLVFAAVASMGFWYYLTGKLFYDIPFSLASFGLCLLLLLFYTRHPAIPYLFWICAGFFISWKPYNIFAGAGLLSLILINRGWRDRVFPSLGLKTWAKDISLCVMGFCLGNYQIFIHPFRTIRGILAYPAASNFYIHMMQGVPLWDHVNNMAASLATFYLPAALIILFVMPLFLPNKGYLISAAVFSALYYLFITYKSPGFLWHSFMPAVYLLMFFIFMLQESESLTTQRQVILRVLAIVAISMQLINNFGFYLPVQVTWQQETRQAMEICRQQSDAMADNLEKIVAELDGPYVLHVNLQRDTVIDGKRMPILLQVNPARWATFYTHVYILQNKPIPQDYLIMLSFAPMRRHKIIEADNFSPVIQRESMRDYDYGDYSFQVFKTKKAPSE